MHGITKEGGGQVTITLSYIGEGKEPEANQSMMENRK